MTLRMGDQTTMKDVFVQCQSGLQGHAKLMKTLHKIYDKTEFATFWSEFCHYLKYAMIIFKREPAVERMIDFVAKFIPLLGKTVREPEEGTEQEEDTVADNQLLQEMFDFLLQSHSAKDRSVRFRCCQLINKLLTNLGEDAQIDDELYERLYECMLERLKDKCPVVRYHAVLAMSRLQDPGDENCPVINAYLFLLNRDPNPDVRRAVLLSIAPSTKTLASIVGRTRDVKDTVRKIAYEVMAEKINIKALSIALRLQLVNEGLNDRSENVKQACSGKMLQKWLRTCEDNIISLLKSLDVEDSTDICTNVLNTLYKASSPQEIVENFGILDTNLLVPVEELVSESSLYWQTVCGHIHELGTNGDEYMDKVLPNCVDFCAYVQRYVEDMKSVEDPEIQLGKEFIIEQLLKIASYMDTADSASRKAIENLLHTMLITDHISYRLVKPVVVRICEIRGTTEAMVPYFAETVSEIREPIQVVEKDVEAEEKRQINVKIAGIRVKLNELREDLDVAIRDQDFTKAADIKATVAQLDAEKVQLLEDSEPAREEIRTEKNDPLTVLKCQTIISEMLQQLKLTVVSPTLQMMIESQIVPGIQNEDEYVRNMAMRALGLCCYLNKDLLVTYIPLFMQASQIDTEGVRVTALQILFDLLHIYGLEIVDASEGSSSSSEAQTEGGDSDITMTTEDTTKSDSRSGTASKLVAIICSFLDGESSELRTCAAEGLAKLLMSGRVVSSKILSHLILLWYNPLSEDDTHLRDCLGTFFPLYALAGRSNQEVVEEAFLPTLRTLLNAPASSPLAEVDVNNVAELLVQLTNTKLVTQNQASTETSQDNPGHDHLSETMCNEILSDPTSNNVKLWVRILNQLEVSPDNEVVLKDLRVLCYKMVKIVKDKVSLRALEKFRGTITEMVSKFVTNDDDLEGIDIQPVVPPTIEEAVVLETTTGEQTPKRKKVRGLYSQNQTLGINDSESELDITQDTSLEVDASCLMSRASVTSDTPTRRGRKNTATSELAPEDDVFTVPEVPEPRKRKSLDKKLEEVSVETVEDNAEKATSEKDAPETVEKTPEKGRKSRAEKKSPSKQAGKSSPTKTASKSPIKSPKSTPDKAQRGRSAEKKKTASKSPEKKSKSKSPTKRTESKSPGRSSSKSPAKKTTSKSPVKKATSTSKSPSKQSSAKSPTKKRTESKSPARSSSKSPSKKSVSKSPSKRTESKSPVRSSSKSPVKSLPKTPTKRQASTSSTRRESASPVKKSRSVSKDNTSKTVEKKKAAEIKSTDKKSTSRSPKVSVTSVSIKKTSKPAEKNIRKAPAKAVDSPAKSSTKSATAAVSSPRGTKQGKTKSVTMSPDIKSPRNTRRAPEKSVADTPEMKSPRNTSKRQSKISIADTPEIKSPKNIRLTRDKASRTPSSQASLTKSVADTPELKSLKKPKNVPSQTTRRPTRGAKSSAGSTSSSASPEKSATARGGKRKSTVTSEDLSSQSSPEAVVKKTIKHSARDGKAAPTLKTASKPSVDTDDDDDGEMLRRKARPSRRSVRASTSAPTPKTTAESNTPSSTRSVKSSSQKSVSSPAMSSPRQPRQSNVSEGKKSDRSTSRDTDQENRAPARRGTRGAAVLSSPESTSSTRTSVRTTKSNTADMSEPRRTVRSSASKKPATPRSQPTDSETDTVSLVSTPGSSTRSTRQKALGASPMDPKQNLSTKLKESAKTGATGKGDASSRAKRPQRAKQAEWR